MGKGPKAITPSTATSQFQGVNNYQVGVNGFGSSTATKNGDTISTNTSLSPGLQNIQNSATQGLAANQQYFNQSPTQQYQDLRAGNNPFYNAQAAQNQLDATNNYNSLQQRMSQGGMQNSTTMGAFAGQQARDYNLTDQTTAANSLDQQNALAQNGLAANSGVLQQLYGYGAGLGDTSNQDLMQGFQNADQTSMFNAGQIQNAAQYNSQAAAQRSAATGGMIGNLLNTGLSLAAIPSPYMYGPYSQFLGRTY